MERVSERPFSLGSPSGWRNAPSRSSSRCRGASRRTHPRRRWCSRRCRRCCWRSKERLVSGDAAAVDGAGGHRGASRPLLRARLADHAPRLEQGRRAQEGRDALVGPLGQQPGTFPLQGAEVLALGVVRQRRPRRVDCGRVTLVRDESPARVRPPVDDPSLGAAFVSGGTEGGGRCC